MKVVYDESDHFHPNFNESVPDRLGSGCSSVSVFRVFRVFWGV